MYIFDWYEIFCYMWFFFSHYTSTTYVFHRVFTVKILLHLTLSVIEFRMYMYMSIYHHYHRRRRQKRKDSGLMLPSQNGCYILHFMLVSSMRSELSSTYLSVCLSIYFEINDAWLAVYNF
jgi:hypothetical protein